MNGLDPKVALVPVPLLVAFLVCVASVAVIGVVLDRRYSVLSSRGRQTDRRRHPYSIARVQFVTIATTVLATWIALGVIKHTWETVTEPASVLVGISFVTCLVASMIEPERPVTIHAGRVAAMLYENSGLALHRMMLAVWTALLCSIVVVTLCQYEQFAEFQWQLVVIFAGASFYYLAFKTLEARVHV